MDYQNQTYFLKVVSEISHVPTMLWSDSFFWTSMESGTHPCQADSAFLHQLTALCPQDHPGMYFENEFVIWGLLQTDEYVIAIGPVLVHTSSWNMGRQYAQFHGMKETFSFVTLSIGEVSRYISLLTCHFLDKAISHEEIIILGMGAEHTSWKSESDLMDYHLMQSEYDRSHQSGRDFEEKVADAVRSGDIEQIKRLLGGDVPQIETTGEIAGEEKKQIEYLMVSLLTLLTRAAVEGGMHPETAYNLGDVYLRRLASASIRSGAFTTLSFKAMYEFAEGVRQAKRERSEKSHIEACKAYVEANLFKNIQVGEIAPALGLSRSYLAHMFRKEEGITLQQYIQREKCRFAGRQLKYTDYSIALIAEYFGFSSPGYFSTCFQKWFGVTPSVYRQINLKK